MRIYSGQRVWPWLVLVGVASVLAGTGTRTDMDNRYTGTGAVIVKRTSAVRLR